MPMIWGPGLTIVLRSLPSLVIPPVLISTLPTILARALPSSSSPNEVEAFLALPAPVRAILSLVAYAVAQKVIGKLRRRRDRKKLGPNVVEVPRMSCWLPGNIDFISEFMHKHATGESYLQASLQTGKLIGEGFQIIVKLLGFHFLRNTEIRSILVYSEKIRCVLFSYSR